MLVLMPGMDGTGDLFAPFLEALPRDTQVQIVRYPLTELLSYSELERFVLDQLPKSGEITLLAESFSGPIALRLAARSGLKIRAVVLVCSFASRPWRRTGALMACLPLTWILPFAFRPALLRRFLIGKKAPNELVQSARSAIASVRREVLAGRLREVLRSRFDSGKIGEDVRVIAIFGKHDRVLPKTTWRSIADAFRHAEIHSVHAPHFALQTEPHQIARRLIELVVLDSISL